MIWFAKLYKITLCLGLLLASLGYFLWSATQPILIESLESKTPTGGPVFNKIYYQPSEKEDVWLMEQSHSGLTAKPHDWDKIAIVVDKTSPQRKAKFFQLMPGEEAISLSLKPIDLKATCFTCHSSGPRAIRPNLDSAVAKLNYWDLARLQIWNLRIKSYGPMTAEGHTIKRAFRHTHPLANRKLVAKACTRCHNGRGPFYRSELTQQNFATIKFMLENRFMPPPGFSLDAADKSEIFNFIDQGS